MKPKAQCCERPAALLLAGLFCVWGVTPAQAATRRPPVGHLAQLAPPLKTKTIEQPRLEINAEVRADGDGLPSSIHGTLKIKDWQTGGASHCLYVPYLDGDYGLDRAVTRRQEMIADKYGRQAFDGGSTSLTVDGAPLPTSGAIVRLEPLIQTTGDSHFEEFTLHFDSSVPRLTATSSDEWFFDGFAPRLLRSCPTDDTIPVRNLPVLSSDMAYSVKIPDTWTYVGPGTLTTEGGHATGALQAAHVAFALTRGQQRLALDIAGVHVDFVYKTTQFLDIVPTVEKTLPLLVQIFGDYPFQKSITIVETSELQRAGLPGLIAVNRAQQGLFDRMQTGWLNWMHWVVVSQLVKQWYGGAIVPESPADEWLTAGIAEFAVLEALSRDPLRFNLFAEYRPGVRLLSLTYLQVSELTAATLRRTAPFAAITTPELVSKDGAREQSPLLFVKQAEALRQMKGLAGDQAFLGFMRQLTAAHLHQTLSPATFYAFLAQKPSAFSPTTRDLLQSSQRQWWTSVGWPDFKLADFKTEELADGRWLADVTASQNGGVDYPPLFGVVDNAGKAHFMRAEPRKKDGLWHGTLPMVYKPIRADVDPTHEAYDTDRFNNSSEPASLQFFPGGADTLRDDAYTIVWLPYVYRLPAEPFSFVVQAEAFRYIAPALFMKFELAPQEKIAAGEVRKRILFDDHALQLDLNLTQDFQHNRQAEASIARSPIWDGSPQAGLALKTRFKQEVGITSSRHQTFVLAGNIKNTDALARCHGDLSAEFEKTPPKFAKGFDYDRSLSSFAADCVITARSNVATRVFYGMLQSTGEVPDQALFRPTELTEARLRIDNRDLSLVRRIASVSSDLLLPFYLPLPSDSLILTRQLRWRLFYDYGRALEPQHEYRSSGLGLLLPFGGDLAGAGSLSLTKLTVLGILYSSVDGVVSRKPGIVFALSGDL